MNTAEDRSIAIASIAFIGDDLNEKIVERCGHRTLRGLQLRLLALAEARFGKDGFRTRPDNSLVGFVCVNENGDTLGLALGPEIGVAP